MSRVYIIAAKEHSDVLMNRLVERLRNGGYNISSFPMELSSYRKKFFGEPSRVEEVRMRLRAVMASDLIATLGGWSDDEICRLEMEVAKAMGLNIVKQKGF